MRLRGVWTLVPEGTLMGRTHMTQHELSAIAPNFLSVQLFASLGFADIRVGATGADIVVEAVRTCTPPLPPSLFIRLFGLPSL